MLGKRYEGNSVCTIGCLQSISQLRKTALRCLLEEGDLNKRCGTSVLFSVYSFIAPVCQGGHEVSLFKADSKANSLHWSNDDFSK